MRSEIKNANVVAVGGGNGSAMLLSGLKTFVGSEIEHLSAIIAVTDDGGSSGRLRDELKMPPPGDIRNCMVALSEDSLVLSRLFQYRFPGNGELGGHSFGNLFLAALSDLTGDFGAAVKLSSEILASKGRIFPVTVANVRLAAKLKNGTVIRGETRIGKAGGGNIEKLFLEPEDCPPMPDALAAIREADIITLGPGSLFTSLLPPLLVPGIADEIGRSAAKKIFVCNLMTQPGETDGFTARKHLEIVREYAPQITFASIIVNGREVSELQAEQYKNEGAVQIGLHGLVGSATAEGTEFVVRDLLAAGEKVRHDPLKLARVVLGLA